MNTDQTWIQKAREQIFGNQRRRAVERRHEKIEREKDNAEFELFLDTCKAEGLDGSNPLHVAIMLRAWMLKKGEELPDDDDGMERDHRELCR